MTETHVLPVDDLVAHDPTRQCLCRPRVDQVWNGDVIIVHHSYDAREYDEDGYVPERADG